jgi:hypothetical protein
MILFQNHQWAVTDAGLQSIEPAAPMEYHIAADRLREKAGAGRGEVYDWPLHMAEKSWVDLGAFVEAFRKALELHAGKYRGHVDPALLEESIDRAYRLNGLGRGR